MRLMSLFDGSGGFCLAGALCGIEPVYSSEIEPFCLRVEALRFPNCKQLGSVTEVNGAEVEPVDIITFGSPCQDLSVAGKQAGDSLRIRRDAQGRRGASERKERCSTNSGLRRTRISRSTRRSSWTDRN